MQSSKYSSKREYERESGRSTNYLRSDRDLSPVPSGTINGSYRTDSPDLDSPRDNRDRSDRYQSSSYNIQKIKEIKDRGRNDYKKDRYLDKRDRRDRDVEHRTNHDRIDVSNSSRRSSKISNCFSLSLFFTQFCVLRLQFYHYRRNTNAMCFCVTIFL